MIAGAGVFFHCGFGTPAQTLRVGKTLQSKALCQYLNFMELSLCTNRNVRLCGFCADIVIVRYGAVSGLSLSVSSGGASALPRAVTVGGSDRSI